MARKDTEKVHRLAAEFRSLIDACDSSRSQWKKDCVENFGYYMSDTQIIFGDTDKDQRARYHFPMVSTAVEALVAAQNSDDIVFRFLPKLEQDSQPLSQGYTMDILARMGTAGFDAIKSLADWHRHMHIMVKSVAIFDCHYLGVCVDYAKRFPDPMNDIVAYHPWQVFSTPGERFEDADEIVISKWVGKEVLKAQYPEFIDELEALPDFGKYDKGRKESSGAKNVTAYGGTGEIPGYGNQRSVVDDDSVQVMERWKRDCSLVETSRKEDNRIIDTERAMIDMIAMPPMMGESMEAQQMRQETMGLAQDGSLYFDEYQYHSSHLVDHVEHLEELQMMMMRQVSVSNGMGSMMMVPEVQDTMARSALDQAIKVLTMHIQITNQAMDDIPPEKEGMKPKFEGGWRQTCIIGDQILAFDGPSIFYEKYAIQGPPLWEFEGMGHPLYHKGPSYVRTMIDHNKILDSTINQIIDNGRLFSNISWWMDEEMAEDIEFNNDPRKPIKIPANAVFGKDFGLLQAQEIPQSLFNLVGLEMSMAQQTSAIHPALEGGKQSGVRSGVQQQTMLQQNLSQLMYKMTRMKPSLEKLATALFKMNLINPPDDAWIKPIIDQQAVIIDWEVLRKIDFAIDVVIKPSGTASAEERSQITLGFLQNFGPMMMQIGMLDVMMEFLAESIKYTMPDMAQVIKQNVEKIRQAQQAQMQQQQIMDAQGGQPPGQGQPNQG